MLRAGEIAFDVSHRLGVVHVKFHLAHHRAHQYGIVVGLVFLHPHAQHAGERRIGQSLDGVRGDGRFVHHHVFQHVVERVQTASHAVVVVVGHGQVVVVVHRERHLEKQFLRHVFGLEHKVTVKVLRRIPETQMKGQQFGLELGIHAVLQVDLIGHRNFPHLYIGRTVGQILVHTSRQRQSRPGP